MAEDLQIKQDITRNCIGSKDRHDDEDTNDDALGPVNEYDCCSISGTGNCQHDGDKVGRQERDNG